MSAIIDNSGIISLTENKELYDIKPVYDDEEDFEGISLPIIFKGFKEINDFIKELEGKYGAKIANYNEQYNEDGYIDYGDIDIEFSFPKKTFFLATFERIRQTKYYITLRSRPRKMEDGSVSNYIQIGADTYWNELGKTEKIIIDHIIRNSSLSNYLKKYWRYPKKDQDKSSISEEDAQKQLEEITPLASEYDKLKSI